ncbi:glycosyltransferase family 2 protein [Flavobacterium sp. LB1P62]|uniref:glycosyltransferase family 2 protein n=1 Tax=Flavobacterium sp. LB1P62 TaxID=3401715 RepID=UPI003AAA8F15
MMPKVSIIMATYNRAQYILESIQSIQAQSHQDWECIIIDDGGTDNTPEILAPILEQDTRFKYFRRTPDYQKGLPGSRNYGIDLAQGDYIIFFDDDDIAHPQNLELCVQELAKKEISFCKYSRGVFFNDFNYKFDFSKEYNSFFIDSNDVERIIKYEIHIKSCDVMWKKKCFIENRFAENILYCEDWELYSRIVSAGFRGVSIDKCLFFYRKHQNSMTGEFYGNDPIRRESYSEALLLVVQNLKEKKLLSNSLLRYLVQISLGFKEYDLFNAVLSVLELPKFEKLKWQLFYIVLPVRLWFYGIWKKLKKDLKK